MKISQNQKIMFAVAMFALTGFIIYKSFFVSSGSVVKTPASPMTTGSVSTLPGGGDNAEGQDILDLANKLSAMSIDSQLFSSPLFKNLKDFDTPLLPEPQGRPNPFAQIGVDVSNQSAVQNFIATTSIVKNPIKKKGL